jgi:polyhydroxyalkanoate synthesis regulator phasin
VASLAASSVLGGGAVGVVLSSPVVAVAQEDTGDAVTDQRAGAIEEVLAGLVADGTITQAQADAVAEALVAALPSRGGRHGHHAWFGISTAAEVIGIDAAELVADLQDGSSVAAVASANGVDAQAVIDALVTEAMERLDQAVADGRLTAEEAADKEADIVDSITAFVNGELDGAPFGPRRGRGFGPGPSVDDGASAEDALLPAV